MTRSPFLRYAAIAAVLALAVFVLLILLTGLSWYIAWLIGGGVATFLLYAWDKFRARSHGGRVPERLLQALVLLGGVAGGWAGMLLFRHKTQHTAFWVVQWVATVIWGALGLWLLL
jgi:uncharacterized membrane protein YsdA (DUF1294 family)